MLSELSLGQEGLAAAWVTAHVSLLAIVLEHMVSQTSLSGETFFTALEIAFERLFASMNSNVVLQGVFSLEGLVATRIRAIEGTLNVVDDAVTGEFGFESENFAAAGESAEMMLLSVPHDFFAGVHGLNRRKSLDREAFWETKVLETKVEEIFHCWLVCTDRKSVV